jgi:hypothetical protein
MQFGHPWQSDPRPLLLRLFVVQFGRPRQSDLRLLLVRLLSRLLMQLRPPCRLVLRLPPVPLLWR